MTDKYTNLLYLFCNILYSNALPGALTHITMTQICVPEENIFSQ